MNRIFFAVVLVLGLCVPAVADDVAFIQACESYSHGFDDADWNGWMVGVAPDGYLEAVNAASYYVRFRFDPQTGNFSHNGNYINYDGNIYTCSYDVTTWFPSGNLYDYCSQDIIDYGQSLPAVSSGGDSGGDSGGTTSGAGVTPVVSDGLNDFSMLSVLTAIAEPLAAALAVGLGLVIGVWLCVCLWHWFRRSVD